MASALPAPDYDIFYAGVFETIEGSTDNGKIYYAYDRVENDNARLRQKKVLKLDPAFENYHPVTDEENDYLGADDGAFGGIVIDRTNQYFCINPRVESITTTYTLLTGWSALSYSAKYEYPSDGGPGVLGVSSTYSYGTHRYLSQVDVTDSDGTVRTRRLKYPADYSDAISAPFLAKGITGVPLEEQRWITANGTTTIVAGQITQYDPATWKPAHLHRLDTSQPLASLNNEIITNGKFTTLLSDTRYQDKIAFMYDPLTGQLASQSKTNDVSYSYLYDYAQTRPVAQVMNSGISDVAYTSFEADAKGNWSYSGTTHPVADAPTGKNTYVLSTGTVSRLLSAGTTYVLSFWSSGSASVQTTGGTSSLVATLTLGGWTFSKRLINGATGVTISGSGDVDEMRLYPSGAQMTTYTYDPLIGQTTVTDPNEQSTYFEYDNFGRLETVYDHDRNIVQHHIYNFKNQY
jgi:YD repeat-containing protein